MTYSQTWALSSGSSVAFSHARVVDFGGVQNRRMVQETEAIWHKNAVSRLDELCQLEIGWDGYRGLPVSFSNAVFALKMLEAICTANSPALQIMPGPSGEVQAEWHTSSADIELYVVAPNNVMAWYKNIYTEVEGLEVALQADFNIVLEWLKETQATDSQIDSVAA